MTKLSRSECTAILSNADRSEVEAAAKLISDKYDVKIVKAPQKTLTMIKMREPVGGSIFYLGEILCCECTVDIGGVIGISVIMGDDFEKAQNCAVIDAAITAGLKECDELNAFIVKLGIEQAKERRKLNGEILKSKVDFHTMGEM